MALIKLTNLKDNKPIYINTKFIGHVYEEDAISEYGKIKTPPHTVVGVVTHNNGGFKVIEKCEDIINLL